MVKAISLVNSRIKNVGIEKDANDVVTIHIVGVGLDGASGEFSVENLVLDWDDLPVNVQNTGSTFLKHLSREFNKLVADEDSDTW